MFAHLAVFRDGRLSGFLSEVHTVRDYLAVMLQKMSLSSSRR